MRWLIVVMAAAGTLTLTSSPSEARTYPWCAYYNWHTYNCGFVTQRQCLATISGVGGWCRRNPQAYRTYRHDRRYRYRY